MQPAVTPLKEPRLRCRGGHPAPYGTRETWQALQAWPETTLWDIWSVLQPLVTNPRGRQPTDALSHFCERHNLLREEVGRAGTLLHNLLLWAAAADLPLEDFTVDLQTLGGGIPAAVILANYEAAKRVLRDRLLHAALAAHGKLMKDLSWRVDTIGDCDGAKALGSPVLVLTFDWQEGDASGRTTLQLTPAMVHRLRSVLMRH